LVTKEATFKASKKTKKKDKQKAKSDSSNSDISEDDEEVANFVRRMKKGTEKYRGKLPLICFNCDGIGHFANKCPHKKKKINEEDDSKRKQIYKGKRTKKKIFKKSLCTKEDSSSSDKDEVSDSDTERVLFMEVEDSDEEGTKEEYEEAEVDYREELLSAIEVIKREKKKNKSLQEELKRKEGTQNSNSEELEKMITKLKIQVEEDKRIEEALKEQLEEKDRIIGSLEAEIVILRKDLQKKNMQNNSKVLDEIISSQRPHHDKSRLGYNQTEKGSSSKTTDQETKKRSYAETVRGSNEKEEDKKFQKEDHRYTPPPRRFRVQNQQQSEVKISQEEEGFRKATPFRRYPTPRYQTIFIGLCYSCNNFGHKAVNCRANNRNKTTMKAIQEMLIQEGLMKCREEATTCLNL
jgi:hypothetical protein